MSKRRFTAPRYQTHGGNSGSTQAMLWRWTSSTTSARRTCKRVAPLAVRMRPRTLDEFVGQQHFLGPGKLLRRMLEADRLTSVIFYGPPGTGKTTLAPAHRAIHARATSSR